jgi:putative serine protease PepD
VNTDDQQGLNTPPFGQPSQQAPHFLPSGELGGYSGSDFPAPAGVPHVSQTPFAPAPDPMYPGRTTTKSPRRLGAILAAASLAAVIGAGAGVGSYAYLVDGGTTSPISVTTVPAANSPTLDGTVAAAAAKIEASLVTITVQSGRTGDIGSGVVLDKDGHILTNNHVVEAAAQQG